MVSGAPLVGTRVGVCLTCLPGVEGCPEGVSEKRGGRYAGGRQGSHPWDLFKGGGVSPKEPIREKQLGDPERQCVAQAEPRPERNE